MTFPLLFLLVLSGATFAGLLPYAVLALYLGASMLAFVFYAFDKQAARSNQWRIRESTLHACSLLGGWPGAWIAQKTLHHKSLKQAFQRLFRISVFLNCTILFLYAFPHVPMQAWSWLRA